MKIYGGINYNEDGISTSVRGMHMQTGIMDTINSNIIGFNKVGYQRSESVVSSFSEYIGIHGLSDVKDDKVGRLRKTGNPLDFALGKTGYFQVKTEDGVKLTRDGRFKIDKEGALLNIEDQKILGSNGLPVKLSKIPNELSDIKVDIDGKIKVFDSKTKKTYDSGQLSVVANNGDILNDVDVRQGHVERSNVSLHTEFFNLVPVKRNFEANRQLFMIQNDALSRTIQQLGTTS